MYNVNIPFYSESSSTRWRQILPRRIATRASCSSELLYRSLSDPKRLLMSRRSESDKLFRLRITARANIFPENAGRSLCSRVSPFPPPSPPPSASSIFMVFSYASGRWWNWRTGARQRAPRWLRYRAGNLFAHFYLRGLRDRVNRRVNRIRSYPIPKEAYRLRDCNRLPRHIVIAIDRVATYGRKLDFAYETRARTNSISHHVLRGNVLIFHSISRKRKERIERRVWGLLLLAMFGIAQYCS